MKAPSGLTSPAPRSGRASALSPSERREQIIAAVVPLLTEHGADVSSKQIADVSGVAEGTIFRAFGDKQSVLAAAAARFFDPDMVRRDLDEVDPQEELALKVEKIIDVLQGRFRGALKVMSAVGYGRPPRGEHDVLEDCVTRIFAPEIDRLGWPPRRIVHLLRLLSFASSIPEVNQGECPFTTVELAAIVVHGILERGTDGPDGPTFDEPGSGA